MINDLEPNLATFKFVDDTALYEFCKHYESSVMQFELDKIVDWSSRNNMELNPNKTKEMIINFNSDLQLPEPLYIGGEKIERVSSTKLLGVYIQDNLQWSIHDYIEKKAASKLYLLSLIVLKRTAVLEKDLVKVLI